MLRTRARAGARAGPGRPGRLRRARGAGPRRQRLRRLPRPAHQPRRALARRPGVGALRGRRARRRLPPRRQPRSGAVHARRRRRVRGRRPAPAQQRRHDRRTERRGGRAVGARRAALGPPARDPGAAAAPADRPDPGDGPRLGRTPHHAGGPRPRSTRRAWRCTPRRSASRRRATRAAATSTARGSSSSSGAGGRWPASTTPASSSRPRSPARHRTPPRSRASGSGPTAGARGSRSAAWPPSSPHVIGSGMAPVVSLYVNEWNAPARATVRTGRFRADRDLRDDDVLRPGDAPKNPSRDASRAASTSDRVGVAFSQPPERAAHGRRTPLTVDVEEHRAGRLPLPPAEPVGGPGRQRRAVDLAQVDLTRAEAVGEDVEGQQLRAVRRDGGDPVPARPPQTSPAGGSAAPARVQPPR